MTKEGAYLATYWSEFGDDSPYESFIQGKFTHTVLTTKAGDKIVGAAVRGKGTLLFLPPLRFDEEEFIHFDSDADEAVWTQEAIRFGKRLVSALSSLSEVLRRAQLVTPPPAWTLDAAFSTEEESTYLGGMAEVSEKITELNQTASSIRKAPGPVAQRVFARRGLRRFLQLTSMSY